MKYPASLFFYLLLITDTNLAAAPVLQDGTIIQPKLHNYEIKQSFGEQIGANLFHSFSKFSIGKGETVNFSAINNPASIQNIIARVTGGERTDIYGTLQSSIANADLYLFNPAGILFGPEAQLDLSGSLYISTANYLSLGEQARFSANNLTTNTFSSAMPSAFGFLQNQPATLINEGANLTVKTGKSLYFIGGDLKFTQQDHPIQAESGQIGLISLAEASEINWSADTLAKGVKGGTIDLFIGDTSTQQPSNQYDSRIIDVSGATAGEISIIGGDINLKGVDIFANSTDRTTQGKGIKIHATGDINLINGAQVSTNSLLGQGTDIDITAQNLNMSNESNYLGNKQNSISSRILTNNNPAVSGQGMPARGGDIHINIKKDLILSDQSQISITTENGSNAGNLSIQTQTLSMQTGASLLLSLENQQNTASTGGNLSIIATDNIKISGNRTALLANIFTAGQGGQMTITTPKLTIENGASIESGIRGQGNAGDIDLQLGQLILNQGYISTRTVKPISDMIVFGAAGNIRINSETVIDIKAQSAISSSTDTSGTGGNIDINTQQLKINNSPNALDTTSYDNGNAGHININAQQSIHLNDARIRAETKKTGTGGNITIHTQNLNLSNHDQALSSATTGAASNAGNINIFTHTMTINKAGISTRSNNRINLEKYDNNLKPIYTETTATGTAGNINISADQQINLLNSPQALSSHAEGNGNAGNINLNSSQIKITDSTISTEAIQSNGGDIQIDTRGYLSLVNGKILTSVTQQAGNGGNITLKPNFLILNNNSQIFAKANQGNGGHINIDAISLYQSADSLINASSTSGTDGIIDTPDPDSNSHILPVINPRLSQQDFKLSHCQQKSDQQRNQFHYNPRLSAQQKQQLIRQIADNKPLKMPLEKQLQQALNQEKQQPQLALTTNQQLLFKLQDPQQIGLHYQAQWLQARLLKKLGKTQLALNHYRAAIRSLQPVRQTLTEIYRQQTTSEFNDILDPLYRQFIDLLLPIDSNNSPQSTQHREEALIIMDQLKAAQLQNYFQDDCQKTPLSLPQLDLKQQLVLYPLFLPERLVLLVRTDGKLLQFNVQMSITALQQNVQQLQQALTDKQSDYLSPASQLYQQLITPIQSHLKDKKYLTFIPDGILMNIPLSVLYDSQQQQYLLEKHYALITLPGIGLQSIATAKQTAPKILYTALTEIQQQHPQRQRYRSIKNFSQPMLNNIQTNFKQVTFLDAQKFTYPNLSKQLQQHDYNILHILSHSEFQANQQAFILTYDSQIKLKQLARLIEQTHNETQSLDLLILAACNTAQGDQQSHFGLAGVAFQAGANSVIANLWRITDVSSYHIFSYFYTQLNQGKDKAQALQNAQLNLLNSAYHHPHYWAPFLLFGQH